MKYKNYIVSLAIVGVSLSSAVFAATTPKTATAPQPDINAKIERLQQAITELSNKLDFLNNMISVLVQSKGPVPTLASSPFPTSSVLPSTSVLPTPASSAMTPAQCLTSQNKTWPTEGGTLPNNMNDALQLCGKFWSQQGTFTDALKNACMSFSMCQPIMPMQPGQMPPGGQVSPNGQPNFPPFTQNQVTCLNTQGVPNSVISDMNSARQGVMITDLARQQAMQQWSSQASKCLSVSAAPTRPTFGAFLGSMLNAIFSR